MILTCNEYMLFYSISCCQPLVYSCAARDWMKYSSVLSLVCTLLAPPWYIERLAETKCYASALKDCRC